MLTEKLRQEEDVSLIKKVIGRLYNNPLQILRVSLPRKWENFFFSTPQALFALLAGLVPILAILEIACVWTDGCTGIEKTLHY